MYSSDSKGDYKGALCTRLKSLTNGLNGQIFTNDELSAEELFDNNVIVDLSRIGSEELTELLPDGLQIPAQRVKNPGSAQFHCHQKKDRPQNHTKYPGHLHSGIDAHQRENGRQTGLLSHQSGLGHPAKQRDRPPENEKLYPPLRGAGKKAEPRPGKQGYSGAQQGQKIYQGQQKGGEQDILLPKKEKAQKQQAEDPKSKKKLGAQPAP